MFNIFNQKSDTVTLSDCEFIQHVDESFPERSFGFYFRRRGYVSVGELSPDVTSAIAQYDQSRDKQVDVLKGYVMLSKRVAEDKGVSRTEARMMIYGEIPDPDSASNTVDAESGDIIRQKSIIDWVETPEEINALKGMILTNSGSETPAEAIARRTAMERVALTIIKHRLVPILYIKSKDETTITLAQPLSHDIPANSVYGLPTGAKITVKTAQPMGAESIPATIEGNWIPGNAIAFAINPKSITVSVQDISNFPVSFIEKLYDFFVRERAGGLPPAAAAESADVHADPVDALAAAEESVMGNETQQIGKISEEESEVVATLAAR